ncbi:hypothetical protein TNCV_1949881 [Trichonephila clavipes]|nr:hypothetical protein TNCV_1949881 [Trichonephila clavipes]
MDVCKCIVPSRHGGTLNSRRAVSTLVRLVEGVTWWETTENRQGVPLKIGVETNQIVLSPAWGSKLRITTVSGKKKLSLHEVLDLLQNLPPESSDVPIDDSSDEDLANYVM